MRTALITGLQGPALTPDEAAFLREVRPAGLILFGRNLQSHDQIRALIDDAQTAVWAEHLLVLIDQEGGRVQRLRPPLGRALPPAAKYGEAYERSPEEAIAAAYAVARLMAEDLRALGINTNCLPVLDLPVAGSHGIIGDRAYGTTTAQVVALADAVAKGHLAGGVLPVMKHIPGHGRATKDSHEALPVVTESREQLSTTDFAPFKALRSLPVAMTAHVVFRAIDPNAPASTSETVTRDIIRGEIGFDGLLMSDDLTMKALSGTIRERAEQVVAAGSDLVLHCTGDMREMQDAAAGSHTLAGRSLERFDAAFGLIGTRSLFDSAAAERALARLLDGAADNTESV
jgi:beta-N-acetylhexosaminidase